MALAAILLQEGLHPLLENLVFGRRSSGGLALGRHEAHGPTCGEARHQGRAEQNQGGSQRHQPSPRLLSNLVIGASGPPGWGGRFFGSNEEYRRESKSDSNFSQVS